MATLSTAAETQQFVPGIVHVAANAAEQSFLRWLQRYRKAPARRHLRQDGSAALPSGYLFTGAGQRMLVFMWQDDLLFVASCINDALSSMSVSIIMSWFLLVTIDNDSSYGD